MSIEQMIDNAIEDWRTSPDAMRWTPEPAKLELAKWQADIARAFGVPAEFLALPRIAGPRMRICEPLRPARISSMRSAYRHKIHNR